MVKDSVSREYQDTELPAVYQKFSAELENYGVNIDRVPQEVHINALESMFYEKELPMRQRFWSGYEDWMILQNMEIEDVEGYAEEYLKAVGRIDRRATGRTPHDRAVDALVHRYIGNQGAEDFDLILRETDFRDLEFERTDSADLSVPGHRDRQERIWSDIDFLGIDAEYGLISGMEVKRSGDSYDIIDGGRVDRVSRQRKRFCKAIESIDESHGMGFDVEHDSRRVFNLNAQNPVPPVYGGELHLVSESWDDESIQGAIEFLEEFAYMQQRNGFRPLEVDQDTEEILGAI